jgi:hypothetical protein
MAQANPVVAQRLRTLLVRFLQPVAARLAAQVDIRLVQTAFDLVPVILIHRHSLIGLLLSELGGYLLGPEQAPAGTKPISNLIHAAGWTAADLKAVLWQQACARVQTLHSERKPVLVVWDGREFEKPDSQASDHWCALRSAKGRRLRRVRKGFSLPPKGRPIRVPGLHWHGISVLGLSGPPSLACLDWWTTRGPYASEQQTLEQQLLLRCALAWADTVWQIWQRGYS